MVAWWTKEREGLGSKMQEGIFSLLGDSILLSTNDGVCEGANGNDDYEQDDIDDDSRGSAYLLQSIFDFGVQTLQKSLKNRVFFDD